MSEQCTAATRIGVIRWHYAREVEPKPFSLFTANKEEIKANAQWYARAFSWGDGRFDEHSHRIA